MRISQTLLSTVLLLSLATNFAVAQVVNQSELGPGACGPCAFVNSLILAKAAAPLAALDGQSGIDKVRAFIKEYGSSTSISYGAARKMYSPTSGTTDVDQLSMINRFFEENKVSPVTGRHVQRLEGENPKEFLSRTRNRIQRSIENGFHPLLSVRALAAEFNESRAKYLWNSMGGHWIAIHAVGDLGRDSLGLPIEFSDSLTGQMKSGVIYAELSRKAVVPLSFTVDDSGKERWNWVPNSQTLSLFAPGMPLGTKRAKWNERTFIAVRFLIARPKP